jgi:hypothetical protein
VSVHTILFLFLYLLSLLFSLTFYKLVSPPPLSLFCLSFSPSFSVFFFVSVFEGFRLTSAQKATQSQVMHLY